MRFTKLPTTLFQEIVLNSGVVLSEFSKDMTQAQMIAAIVGATSGDIKFQAKPDTSDYGEDINNCPVNVKELKMLDDWVITLDGSYVSVNAALLVGLIGAADIDSEDATHIVPRNDFDPDKDFNDLWLVCDYSRKNGDTAGGYIAIHMMNALSTDGFSLTSKNRGKGTMDFSYTAHYTIEDQETVPFEVYLVDGEDEEAA